MMGVTKQVHDLLRQAERLERRPMKTGSGKRTMTGAASVLRYRARRLASAALMAPKPEPRRTAEQALAELRQVMP